MASFIQDLKLLHPTLSLSPRRSSDLNWKAKLVDPAVSLAEWSKHALNLLKDVGGNRIPSSLPDDSELPAVNFFPEIVENTLSLVLADIFDIRSSVKFRHELDSRFPWWRESNLWLKANRYPHYDQFLNFVAFASSASVPEHAKSNWATLACATLVEVHYFDRFVKSRLIKKYLQIEGEEFNDYFKRALDDAFEIYRHCDLALRTRDGSDSDTETELPESAEWKLYRSFSNRLSSAICTAARRMAVLPKQMYLEGVIRTGSFAAGIGGFADVWMGKLNGGNGDTVALKVPRLHTSCSEKIKALMYKEVFVWHRLHHRNILPLLGVTKDKISPCILISPWMANGNLWSYLKRNHIGNLRRALHGVQAGLSYLHGQRPPVVHGDIRCANILVDNTGTPLLADFGLSKAQDELALLSIGSSITSTCYGSMRWMAPELAIEDSADSPGKRKRTTMSDVYAFAMTCLEAYSGKVPFDGYHDTQIPLKLHSGHTPDIPDNIKTSNKIKASIREEWWAELQRCWRANAAERPDIGDMTLKRFNPCMWQIRSEEDDFGNSYYWYQWEKADNKKDSSHQRCEATKCFFRDS